MPENRSVALGRRSKLTKQLIERICEQVEAGNYIRTACGNVGISESTFHALREKGESGFGGLYLEFVEALKKSEAAAEANLLSIIQADPSWQSKAWILERRCPEHWGRRGRLDASLNSNVEVKFTAIKELSEEEWNEQVVNRGNRLELPA